MADLLKITWTLKGIIAVWARGRDLPVNKGDIDQLCEVIYEVAPQIAEALDKRACLGCRGKATSHTCRRVMHKKLYQAHEIGMASPSPCICAYCLMYREEHPES